MSAQPLGADHWKARAALAEAEVERLRTAHLQTMGIPPSEHQARRLEAMADLVEATERDRDELQAKVARVEALADEWATTHHLGISRRRAAELILAAIEGRS